MKFLCLAYGDEAGWNALSPAAKEEVLAADAKIRATGALMSAVRPDVATVSNHDRHLVVRAGPHAGAGLPLAGFSVIEADTVEAAIALVAESPCARAGGCIEIRALWDAAAG